MPNTLAHLGVQGVVTRGLLPGADFKWIYLGCVVPDLPWILRRAVDALVPSIPAYDLRLYAIVQSSLFMCVLLSSVLTSFSSRPLRVFFILALGSLLHLLLDALQTKWGNGVHLFAPFSWELLNFGFFWPEDLPTYLLTAFGLLVFAYAWWRLPFGGGDLRLPGGRRGALTGALLLAYLLAPFFLFDGPEGLDSHSVKTLRAAGERAGRLVEFDRNRYLHDPAGDTLVTFAGERLRLDGMVQDHSGTVSLRGRFLDPKTVMVSDLHAHRPLVRDLSSYLGLVLLLLVWARAIWARGRG